MKSLFDVVNIIISLNWKIDAFSVLERTCMFDIRHCALKCASKSVKYLRNTIVVHSKGMKPHQYFLGSAQISENTVCKAISNLTFKINKCKSDDQSL